MKKINRVFIVTLLVCSLTGCAGTTKKDSANTLADNAEITNATTEQASQTESVEEKTTQSDGVNQLSLFIYNKNSGYREISDGFVSTWVKGEDIVSFEAYATKEKSFSLSGSNFRDVWQGYWNQYPKYEKDKLGYIVDFKLKSGEEIKKTILGPNDVFGFRNYLECYLYDDVNQIQGNWYSHLLDTQVTDATVMTSIKFTAGVDIEQLGDEIKLTAFVYDPDKDIDANGNYTGNVSYSVVVKNAAN